MAEWCRPSVSGAVDSGFNSESGRTNNFKIVFLFYGVVHIRKTEAVLVRWQQTR